MATATALPAPRLIDVDGLGALCRALVADGYHVIGPAVQDGAIALRELSLAAELPFGWGVELEPGGCRLRRVGMTEAELDRVFATFNAASPALAAARREE